MNKEILLTYTKISEDAIEDIFHIDTSQQQSQLLRRSTHILGNEFFPLLSRCCSMLQQTRCAAQQKTLPLPGNQPSLTAPKVPTGEVDQQGQQLCEAIAALCRNCDQQVWPG
jgi:hypothetical protein